MVLNTLVGILLGLGGFTAPAPAMAQYQICVWPNPCAGKAAAVAQVQTCVWPNPCRTGNVEA